MTHTEYNALRRAAYEAAQAYSREAGSDGRSSYASHGIRCTLALQAAQSASNRVPRDRGESLESVRRIHRRRRVRECIRERNLARDHYPHCLPFYQRQLLGALHPIEVTP